MTSLSIFIAAAAATFAIFTYRVVQKGDSKPVRFWGAAWQCTAFAFVLVIAMPKQIAPQTDVGRFADAMTRTHGERLAAILNRKQQEKVDAIQLASHR